MVKTGSKGVNFLNLVENQYVKSSHVLQETGYTMLSIKIMIFFQSAFPIDWVDVALAKTEGLGYKYLVILVCCAVGFNLLPVSMYCLYAGSVFLLNFRLLAVTRSRSSSLSTLAAVSSFPPGL
jgi:hypothetical protein